MKYPVEQFEVLVETLQELDKYIDLSQIGGSNLHYIVYQQFSEGQLHNRLIIQGGEVAPWHKIDSTKPYALVINKKLDFELYPKGCNDTHIDTAIKRALKLI